MREFFDLLKGAALVAGFAVFGTLALWPAAPSSISYLSHK